MTYSIEFQMISKDAASKRKHQVSQTTVMKVFGLKTLKIKGTVSKMSDKKKLSL